VSVTPIGEHAVLGDGRSAALVSREGTIDWLCWPRFDSPSFLCSLLDEKRGGALSARPTSEADARRRYLPDTNVLETTFVTDGGTLRVLDLMTVASEEEKGRDLTPEHEIVRELCCERGTVEVELRYEPRPCFGRRARISDRGSLGTFVDTGREGVFVLRSEIPLAPGESGLVGRARLHASERRQVSLVHAWDGPAVLRPLGPPTRAAIESSIAWWRRWASRSTYRGPHRDEVVRSALVLKLLAFAPSGAIVAAPTTSLPERLGGALNWDYRYCWLRDAAFTARALFGLGYQEEAVSWVSWLVHTTRLTRPEIKILYDVYGERAPREREIGLAGYRGSRPVRVGNGAISQLQLDVYGEVMDAATYLLRRGGDLDRDTEQMLEETAEYVLRHWRLPDEGIWEVRSGRFHHTHSRLLSWVALDRALALKGDGSLRHLDGDALTRERSAIRSEIETSAWNDRLGSYVRRLDGDELDASLLQIPWYGFEPASSDRMRLTFARIKERLGAGPGLYYRYQATPDESPGEGAFALCSFWAAECLALGGGSLEEARAEFELVLPFANDVGLLGEEIDPTTGDALGNFPQAYTHVGLVNTALTLEERARGEIPTGARSTPCDRWARRRAA
jgi:GH15 family glucan-1,4-alpha-glucosidase